MNSEPPSKCKKRQEKHQKNPRSKRRIFYQKKRELANKRLFVDAFEETIQLSIRMERIMQVFQDILLTTQLLANEPIDQNDPFADPETMHWTNQQINHSPI